MAWFQGGDSDYCWDSVLCNIDTAGILRGGGILNKHMINIWSGGIMTKWNTHWVHNRTITITITLQYIRKIIEVENYFKTEDS